jgi:hypothetical protein
VRTAKYLADITFQKYETIIPFNRMLNWEGWMAAAEKRTFSLPTEQANYIDSLVAPGGYASASEVIRAGSRAVSINPLSDP